MEECLPDNRITLELERDGFAAEQLIRVSNDFKKVHFVIENRTNNQHTTNLTVHSTSVKNITVKQIVDARGTACPGPLLAAKKAIGELESGEIMEILSSDEGTKNDIPKWCQKMTHEFLGIIEEDSYSRLFLKKA